MSNSPPQGITQTVPNLDELENVVAITNNADVETAMALTCKRLRDAVKRARQDAANAMVKSRTTRNKRKPSRDLQPIPPDVIARAALPQIRKRGCRVLRKVKHVCTMLSDEDIVVLEKHVDEQYVRVTAINGSSFELRFRYVADAEASGVERKDDPVEVYALRYNATNNTNNFPRRFGPSPSSPLILPIKMLIDTPQELLKRFPESARKYINNTIKSMRNKVEHGKVKYDD